MFTRTYIDLAVENRSPTVELVLLPGSALSWECHRVGVSGWLALSSMAAT
jgi:hypothetical protein